MASAIDEIDNIIFDFMHEIINYISISEGQRLQLPELYNYVLDKHYDWKHTCRQKLNFTSMYFFQ